MKKYIKASSTKAVVPKYRSYGNVDKVLQTLFGIPCEIV